MTETDKIKIYLRKNKQNLWLIIKSGTNPLHKKEKTNINAKYVNALCDI